MRRGPKNYDDDYDDYYDYYDYDDYDDDDGDDGVDDDGVHLDRCPEDDGVYGKGGKGEETNNAGFDEAKYTNAIPGCMITHWTNIYKYDTL